MNERTIHLIRHAPKGAKLDGSPASAEQGVYLEVYEDNNAIKTESDGLVARELEKYAGVRSLLASPRLRAQQTAHLFAQGFGKQGVEMTPTVVTELSDCIPENEFANVSGAYNIQGTYFAGVLQTCFPPLVKWSEIFPDLDIKTIPEWDTLRAYFARKSIAPYHSAQEVGQRAAQKLAKEIFQGDALAVTHSGIMEPTVAACINQPIEAVLEIRAFHELDFFPQRGLELLGVASLCVLQY